MRRVEVIRKKLETFQVICHNAQPDTADESAAWAVRIFGKWLLGERSDIDLGNLFKEDYYSQLVDAGLMPERRTNVANRRKD